MHAGTTEPGKSSRPSPGCWPAPPGRLPAFGERSRRVCSSSSRRGSREGWAPAERGLPPFCPHGQLCLRLSSCGAESVPLCISVRDPDGPPPAKRATTGLAALLPQAGCSRVRQLTRGKGVLRRPSELTRGERLVACPSVFPLNGNFQRPSPWFWIKGAHPWRGWKVACDFDSPRPYVVSVYLGWAPGSRTPGRPNPQTPRSPA